LKNKFEILENSQFPRFYKNTPELF
jgi:hypothetical protein